MKKRMIIAIDFDGTIVENKYPEIGELREGAVEFINKLYDEGHYIVINTCRSGLYEQHAKDFLEIASIKYHKLNENLEHRIEEFGGDCRKISADVYIDDKNLKGIHDTWEDTYKALQEMYGKVKYLDKEDIESLGFIRQPDSGGLRHEKFKSFYTKFGKTSEGKPYGSTIYFDNIHVHSYIQIDLAIAPGPIYGHIGVTAFKGIIKNKSELKVLLKQLTIL